MSTLEFRKRLDGIICPNCTGDIARRLTREKGISNVRASYIRSELSLNYDTEVMSEERIEEILLKMGYPVGKGRNNVIADALGILCIAVLYFVLTYLTGIVPMPETGGKLSLGMIFLTGLLGGVHCIGMCGGIMLTQHNAIGYNGGRLLGYTIMGIIFGAVRTSGVGDPVSQKAAAGTSFSVPVSRNSVPHWSADRDHALRHAILHVARSGLRSFGAQRRGSDAGVRTGDLRRHAAVRRSGRCADTKIQQIYPQGQHHAHYHHGTDADDQRDPAFVIPYEGKDCSGSSGVFLFCETKRSA